MIKTTTINAGKYYWVKTCKECEWRIAEAYILVSHMRLRFTDGCCVPVKFETMEWIDIKVKRPKEGEIVWAILEDEHSPVMLMREFIVEESAFAFTRIYDVPFWAGSKWYAEAHYDEDYKVTYWLPLPSPR